LPATKFLFSFKKFFTRRFSCLDFLRKGLVYVKE